jgi:hypothetical protein
MMQENEMNLMSFEIVFFNELKVGYKFDVVNNRTETSLRVISRIFISRSNNLRFNFFVSSSRSSIIIMLKIVFFSLFSWSD